jgi:pyridoxal phosphate enzyme (YggS family)
MIDPVEVAERVAKVRRDISDRTDRQVSIVAVTKTFGVDAWVAAHDAGCNGLGENYAQELIEKTHLMAPPLPVHFIGALQSNKVKSIAPFVSVWQGVDRESVVDEIARRSPGASVLLQVNTTGEVSKSGVSPDSVESLCRYATGLGLDVKGLMTLGPTAGGDAETRASFELLRALADSHGLVDCSMGMSGDYRLAVECGATIIRLGTTLFGARTARG